MKVSKDHLEYQLSGYPLIQGLIGRYYDRLLERDELTDDLLPTDPEATEADLRDVVAAVAGFEEHWHQNPLGNPRADLLAALAEIEAFRAVAALGYRDLEALPIKPVRGGGAPDAVGVADGMVQAFEVKSLWAYLQRRQHHLREGPAGAYEFGRRPPGGSVADALRRAGGYLPDGEWNSLILDLTIRRLLRNAAKQLNAYRRHGERPVAYRIVTLVVTRGGQVLEFVDAGRDLARNWLLHHRDQVTNVLWVGGSRFQWLLDAPPLGTLRHL